MCHKLFDAIYSRSAMDDLAHIIGKRLKEKREADGLSQRRFALMINMNRTYLSGVEHGTRNISLFNIEKIAKGLNLPLEDLFRGL